MRRIIHLIFFFFFSWGHWISISGQFRSDWLCKFLWFTVYSSRTPPNLIITYDKACFVGIKETGRQKWSNDFSSLVTTEWILPGHWTDRHCSSMRMFSVACKSIFYIPYLIDRFICTKFVTGVIFIGKFLSSIKYIATIVTKYIINIIKRYKNIFLQ